MTPVAVLYLDQIICLKFKLKILTATYGSARCCHGPWPGGISRNWVLSVCNEWVSFLSFAALSFLFSVIFFGLLNFFLSVSLSVNRKHSLRCKQSHPV